MVTRNVDSEFGKSARRVVELECETEFDARARRGSKASDRLPLWSLQLILAHHQQR